ncbi:MAG TPA: CoA pyrophosphatase [Steroidobacteraceae bacterium]|nr:CoA pyrophosphatase [Steroidobacteraceae bacterium]
MSLGLPEQVTLPSLKERIVQLLRDTVPGAEPEFPYAVHFTPEQVDALRQFLPERLARAAVLVPLVERPDGLNVLLTLRASHLKNHAGQISFPGGRIEESDAGPWEAALREAREEIGLEARYVSLAGYLPDHIVISGFRVTPVVALVNPGFNLRLDTTEVEDAFEVPLEFALDPANQLPRERHFAGHTILTCDIRYHDRQIWGATASMLLTLSRLLRAGAS